MAEAVASIIGIATFSVQVGEQLYKVRQLYEAIKTAPEDITALLQDCERLSKLLSHNATQSAQFAGLVPPSTSWHDCQESCNSALRKLEAIARELDQQIGKSRFTGSVKTLLRQDAVAKQKSRLSNVRDDLLLALQSLNMCVLLPCGFSSDITQSHILPDSCAHTRPGCLAISGTRPPSAASGSCAASAALRGVSSASCHRHRSLREPWHACVAETSSRPEILFSAGISVSMAAQSMALRNPQILR